MSEFNKSIMDENDYIINYFNIDQSDYSSDEILPSDTLMNYIWLEQPSDIDDSDIFINYIRLHTQNSWEIKGNLLARIQLYEGVTTINPIYQKYKRVMYKPRLEKPILGIKNKSNILSLIKVIRENNITNLLQRINNKRSLHLNIDQYINIVEEPIIESILRHIEQYVHKPNYLIKEDIKNILKSYSEYNQSIIEGIKITEDDSFIYISPGQQFINGKFINIENKITIVKEYLYEEMITDYEKYYYLCLEDKDGINIQIKDNTNYNKNTDIILAYLKFDIDNVSVIYDNPNKNLYYDKQVKRENIDISILNKLEEKYNEFENNLNSLEIENKYSNDIFYPSLNNDKLNNITNFILNNINDHNNFSPYEFTDLNIDKIYNYNEPTNLIMKKVKETDYIILKQLKIEKPEQYNKYTNNIVALFNYDEDNKLNENYIIDLNKTYDLNNNFKSNEYYKSNHSFYKKNLQNQPYKTYDAQTYEYDNSLYTFSGKNENEIHKSLYQYDFTTDIFTIKPLINSYNKLYINYKNEEEAYLISNSKIYKYNFINDTETFIKDLPQNNLITSNGNQKEFIVGTINDTLSNINFYKFLNIENDLIYTQYSNIYNYNIKDNEYGALFDNNYFYMPNDNNNNIIKLENTSLLGNILKSNYIINKYKLPYNIYKGQFTKNSKDGVNQLYGGIKEISQIDNYNPYIYQLKDEYIITIGINDSFKNDHGYGNSDLFYIFGGIKTNDYITVYHFELNQIENVNIKYNLQYYGIEED